MSNNHVAAPFRAILDSIAGNHRTAHEELREGLAALARVNKQGEGSMPQEPRRTIIIHEYPESPDQAWDWRAQLAGDENPAHWGWGCSPRQALADLLLLEEEWLAEEVEALP